MSPAGIRPAALAVLLLATACSLPPPRPEVARRLHSITPSSVSEHVEALAAVGPRPGRDAEATRRTLDLLSDRMRSWGYEPVEEPFTGNWQTVTVQADEESGQQTWRLQATSGEAVNLVAEKRGSTRPEVIVELVAHYDTVPGSPGADDNASGMAAVLEVARVIADAPVRRTVRFCFVALEEEGLQGSRAHAERLSRSVGETLDGALVLDMVAYTDPRPDSQQSPVRIPFLFSPPHTANFMLLAGNHSSAPLADHFERCVRRYAPTLELYAAKRLAGWVEESQRADQASYWRHDLRAILVNDTAELRSPHYHRGSDRPATLDAEALASVARAACAWALERGDLPWGEQAVGSP